MPNNSQLTIGATQQKSATCRNCNASISKRLYFCSQFRSKYHSSCALVTGTTSTRAYNCCCDRKANSPMSFSLDILKNLVIDKLKVDLKNLIVSTIKECVSTTIKEYIQEKNDSFKSILKNSMQEVCYGGHGH